MGRQSQHTAWNVAIMKCLVLISCVLACVSSVPFDAGYGIPAAPVIEQPAPALLPATTGKLIPATLNTLNTIQSANIINQDLGIDITRTMMRMVRRVLVTAWWEPVLPSTTFT